MAAAEDCRRAKSLLSDWRWRLNNLYFITDKAGQKVKFEMNWAQSEFFEGMHYLNVILKARQFGFTTFIQLFQLDACMFNSNIRAGTIADTRENAETIFRDKIKFAYDSLPEGLKAAISAQNNSARELLFSNNSSIRVGTSLRGGTLQYLHISEFGKICAKYPHKAREIVTGALNTVQAGQFVMIESTAEGQEGYFYDMCQTAQSQQRQGGQLTSLDFKFHFFPWWRNTDYQLSPDGVIIPPKMAEYFGRLEGEGVTLTAAQRAWYVKKAEQQGGDMKREFPATPEEAFEAAIEGAYYAEQMTKAEAAGRVGRVPYDPALPVETWWDLGMSDQMSIWFIQRYQRELRVIGFYGNSGEGLPHYAKVLDGKPYVYSRHVLPHDVAVRELGTGKSRKEVLQSLGFKNIEVAPRLEIADGIDAVRSLLPRCWFDAEACAEGLKALRAYRKEWDDKLGVWKSYPRHDWASHPADAFRTGAVAPDPSKTGFSRDLNYPRTGIV